MAEPFLSEIRMMSFVFAPKGWALCNGQLLPINQNQALFSLLGTTFGGDGRVNFALPDLRGRTPIHVGQAHTLGERGGEPAHTLTISELPTHPHVAQATSAMATIGTPTTSTMLANSAQAFLYSSTATNLAGHERRHDRQYRRLAGTPQHAAVPHALVLHRPAGHLPKSHLKSVPPGRAQHR